MWVPSIYKWTSFFSHRGIFARKRFSNEFSRPFKKCTTIDYNAGQFFLAKVSNNALRKSCKVVDIITAKSKYKCTQKLSVSVYQDHMQNSHHGFGFRLGYDPLACKITHSLSVGVQPPSNKYRLSPWEITDDAYFMTYPLYTDLTLCLVSSGIHYTM